MLALSHTFEAPPTPPPSEPADQLAGPHDLALSAMMPRLVIAPPVYPPSSPAHSPPSWRSARPRLKLNTQEIFQPTTFGNSGASSLRLDTLSAVSPTVRNTFSNAYERQSQPPTSSHPPSDSCSKPLRPRLALDVQTPTASKEEEPSPTTATAFTPTSASVTSATSTDSTLSSSSASIRIPYKPSFNVRSILRNSPLPRMSAAASRPLFPPQKRVSFRTPIDEEIRTTKYTVAHSELELPAGSCPASSSSAPSQKDKPATSPRSSALCLAVSDKATKPKIKRRSPRTGDKRESDSDSDGCPETPVAGRRKKQREWVWTLGPINGQRLNSSDDDTDLSETHSNTS